MREDKLDLQDHVVSQDCLGRLEIQVHKDLQDQEENLAFVENRELEVRLDRLVNLDHLDQAAHEEKQDLLDVRDQLDLQVQ